MAARARELVAGAQPLRNDVVDKTGRVIDVAAPFDVVVVGIADIDTNVYLGAPWGWATRLFFTDKLDGVGQSGGYCARGFARLGYRPAFVGYVGADPQCRFLVDRLALSAST